jgi:alkyl hydroperoxide reductase subunit AhpC
MSDVIKMQRKAPMQDKIIDFTILCTTGIWMFMILSYDMQGRVAEVSSVTFNLVVCHGEQKSHMIRSWGTEMMSFAVAIFLDKAYDR